MGLGRISRRQAATILVAAAGLWARADAQPQRTRLILLGTGGGPRPRRASSASAQVIIAGGQAFVIDCGDGVARQLAIAGVPLTTLRHVFITHHHSDHNADYGNLIWLGWTAGLRTRVDTWGPPPLKAMTDHFFLMNAYDIETRIADEGRTPLIPLVHVHELTKPGVVLQADGVTVTAAFARHPPVVPAFAYRFDTADRSIVISGDTAPTDDIIALAKGADVLVHDALFPAGVDRLVAGVPNATRLKGSIMSHHTTAADAGRIAATAGVATLVLSHLVPPDDPAISEQMWIEAARVHFKGRIILGKDLLEI